VESRDDARDMLAWAGSGFSLDASECIAGHDRAGLERLPRYCARPPFAHERIKQVPAGNGEQQVVGRPPKPRRGGRTALSLIPLEFVDHLADLFTPRLPAATVYGRDADVNRDLTG